jgi:hypothetical protein
LQLRPAGKRSVDDWTGARIDPFVAVAAGATNALTAAPVYEGGIPEMLWLIVAIILLVIAIAGGAIVHPILFALGIVALILFFMHFRRGSTAF